MLERERENNSEWPEMPEIHSRTDGKKSFGLWPLKISNKTGSGLFLKRNPLLPKLQIRKMLWRFGIDTILTCSALQCRPVWVFWLGNWTVMKLWFAVQTSSFIIRTFRGQRSLYVELKLTSSYFYIPVSLCWFSSVTGAKTKPLTIIEWNVLFILWLSVVQFLWQHDDGCKLPR